MLKNLCLKKSNLSKSKQIIKFNQYWMMFSWHVVNADKLYLQCIYISTVEQYVPRDQNVPAM